MQKIDTTKPAFSANNRRMTFVAETTDGRLVWRTSKGNILMTDLFGVADGTRKVLSDAPMRQKERLTIGQTVVALLGTRDFVVAAVARETRNGNVHVTPLEPVQKNARGTRFVQRSRVFSSVDELQKFAQEWQVSAKRAEQKLRLLLAHPGNGQDVEVAQ